LLGAGWLALALAAARTDWPTPEKLAEQRYRLAQLTANAADKSYRPDPAAAGGDWDGAYARLAADYAARPGTSAAFAALEARHQSAVDGMPGEQGGLVVFTLAATAVLWRLGAAILAALPRQAGQA
jgi:hypothetical protein